MRDRLARLGALRPGRGDGERVDGAEEPLDPVLSARAARTRLVLHIGMHKTASTYVQGLLAALRQDLRGHGVLYPRAGVEDKAAFGTREGAGSGQALFAKPRSEPGLRRALLEELTDDVSTVLVSSEEFSRFSPPTPPAELLARLEGFGSVEVVVVLRRQDDWAESYYKQVVDQFANFETRSFDDWLEEAGLAMLDLHGRFAPWRDLVGPERFHVLSYDDLGGGTAIARRLLEVAGVTGPVLDDLGSVTVPRYDSVRAIDTLGLRVLNGLRLDDRAVRTRIAREIYAAAPAGDVALLTPGVRARIQELCAPVNERIETEWASEALPGFRFGGERGTTVPDPPAGPEVLAYVDRVVTLCREAEATPRRPHPAARRRRNR